MKTTTKRYSRKATRFFKRITWEKIIRVVGGVTAFAGLAIMACAVGSLEGDLMTLKSYVLLAMLGVTMLAAGCFIAHMYTFQQPDDYEDPSQTYNPEEIIGAMAYNRSYHSWMMVTKYKNDRNWTFVLCSQHGKSVISSPPIRTFNDITDYRWVA